MIEYVPLTHNREDRLTHAAALDHAYVARRMETNTDALEPLVVNRGIEGSELVHVDQSVVDWGHDVRRVGAPPVAKQDHNTAAGISYND